MATKKQIEANRRNAKLSTGPKTPEGKAIVSQNRCSHGLCSRDTVLPKEDRAAYEALVSYLEARFEATNPLDQILVRQVASADWRLRRINRMEVGLLISRVEKARDWEEVPDEGPEPERTEEEEQYDEDSRFLGDAFLQNAGRETLAKLTRYENSIRRGLFKALDRLEKYHPSAVKPAAIETQPPAPSADPSKTPQTTAPETKSALNRTEPSNGNATAPNNGRQPAPPTQNPPSNPTTSPLPAPEKELPSKQPRIPEDPTR